MRQQDAIFLQRITARAFPLQPRVVIFPFEQRAIQIGRIGAGMKCRLQQALYGRQVFDVSRAKVAWHVFNISSDSIDTLSRMNAEAFAFHHLGVAVKSIAKAIPL